jgi:hypothetical protein
MPRVRFAPSPTGSLHVGNALTVVANRAFGDWMLLRIDDTDAARNVPDGEQAIVRDLEWGRSVRASVRTHIVTRRSGSGRIGSIASRCDARTGPRRTT